VKSPTVTWLVRLCQSLQAKPYLMLWGHWNQLLLLLWQRLFKIKTNPDGNTNFQNLQYR
jgi:hypothetical protein